MSELFDKANEYALNSDVVMGGRMATRFADEGKYRLQAQALKLLSAARLRTRREGIAEDKPAFQAKTIAHLKLEAQYDNWDKQTDGSYTKTFKTHDELVDALIFISELGVHLHKTDKEALKDSVTLRLEAHDHDLIFTPSRFVAAPDEPAAGSSR